MNHTCPVNPEATQKAESSSTAVSAHSDPAPHDGAVRREPPEGVLAAGQWYWVKEVMTWDDRKSGLKRGDEYEWLGCVVDIGTNYALLKAPPSNDRGSRSDRVHFDDFWKRLRLEPNADIVIAGKVEHYQRHAQELLAEVQALTMRLGIAPARMLSAGAVAGTSLATVSGQTDIRSYEAALIKARDVTLPELFEQIKEANAEVARWMTASTLTMEAQIAPLSSTLKEVKDRVFNVGLYAGLAEEVVRCCDGAPAAAHEKLRVMQRRLYMDEECLMSYEAGGMEFADIGEFDAWISQPANRDRILPFPRTLVAMRVRRVAATFCPLSSRSTRSWRTSRRFSISATESNSGGCHASWTSAK
jgi:hypothetical protein